MTRRLGHRTLLHSSLLPSKQRTREVAGDEMGIGAFILGVGKDRVDQQFSLIGACMTAGLCDGADRAKKRKKTVLT